MLKPIQNISLANEVVDQLKNLILNGDLQPGERFPTEYELCEQLNVSRTAIREAKKSLIGMGLLETRRGQGTYIRSDLFGSLMETASMGFHLAKGSIEELIEARRIIEVASAGLAAERASEENKQKLQDLVDQMQMAIDQGDMDAFQKDDLAWHTTIAESTKNEMIAKMVATTRNVLASFIDAVLQIPGSARIAQINHKRVTDAILAMDKEGAEVAMHEHLDDVQMTIMEHLSELAQ